MSVLKKYYKFGILMNIMVNDVTEIKENDGYDEWLTRKVKMR